MPTITYNLDIPFEDNNPSDDQPDMKTNTNAVDEWVAVDHIGFNDNYNLGGIHNVARFPDQSQVGTVPPSLPTGLGGIKVGGLYALPANGDIWPIWRNAASGVNNGTFLFTGDTNDTPTSGRTFITGGIILAWGRMLNPGLTGSIVFSDGGFPTACFQVMLQMELFGGITTASTLVTARSQTGFDYSIQPALSMLSNLTYLAIGN